MKYINVNRNNLILTVSYLPTSKGLSLPMKISNEKLNIYFGEVLFYNILYPIHSKNKPNVKAKLFEPDPWLIALTYIMWEGIVQGLTWDMIKILCKNALLKLKKRNIVLNDNKNVSTSSSLKFGLTWKKYLNENNWRELFIGFQSIYETSSQNEINKITKSCIKRRKSKKKMVNKK